MLIDLHVHTDRHSGCSQMSPEAMARTAIARGLDGIVITEHDYLWSRAEVTALQNQFPALHIFRGIEVSTAEGHALVYNVAEAEVDAFTWHIPLTELADIVHQSGGAVILAHPTRYDDKIPDAVYHAGLDGVEAMSMNVRHYMADAIEHLQSDLDLPGVAGTDAHTTESLGYYATDFHATVHAESDLVEGIRSRAFSLYSDSARIAEYNAGIAEQVAQMQALLSEDTLTAAEIKATYRLSYSFQKGVRRGKGMHLRAGPWRTEEPIGAQHRRCVSTQSLKGCSGE